MSEHNLALPPSTDYSQPTVLEFLDAIVSRAVAGTRFPTCEYDCPESKFGCGEKATITDYESGMTYCARHFGEAQRG